jgi:hypothetical protein
MISKEHARAAAFFAFANLAAGLLHYLFLVWSSAQVSVLEFGVLNSWIAYFSVTLSIGAFAQYGANFFIASRRFLKLVSWFALAVGVASLFGPWLLGKANGFMIGGLGVGLGVVFYWCMGQAQARLAFIIMGVGVLVAGISKFALAGVGFPAERESLELAWAVALAYSPGLIWLAVILLILGPKWPRLNAKVHGLATGLGASAILSFASVLIPQLDIIVIHQTQDPETIGEFARVSLLYKAVFFGFLILAQWLLPHQMASTRNQPGIVKWMGGNRWGVLGLGAGLGFLAFAGSQLMGPWIGLDLHAFGIWVALSCLNMVFLTTLFFSIQLDCVEQDLKSSGLALGALVLEMIAAIMMKLPVTQYLAFVVIVNASLWVALTRDPAGKTAKA